ncbi:MAG: outer membrane beta-barrel protein [Smithella sp.]
MNKIVQSLAVFIFVLAVFVFPFNTASAQEGLYLGVFGGYAFSPDASWENYDSDYDLDYNSGYDLDVQESGLFGVKFGSTAPPPTNFLSAEFEYSYLNPDINRTVLATAGTDFSAIEGDVKFHNFMLNIIVKYPEGRIHPYTGFGIGASYFDLSVNTTSNLDGVNYSERRSVDDTVFAWQVLAGVDVDLTNNMSLDIGCRYFDTESLDGDYEVYYNDDHNHAEHDDDHDNGPTLDFKTFIVTLGLKFRF